MPTIFCCKAKLIFSTASIIAGLIKAQVLTIHTPNGSKQFLAHHAKTIYAITPGLLKIRKEDNSEIEVVSGLGSMIFSNNQAEVLVDTCETQEELDARRAKESLERAKERMRQKQSYAPMNFFRSFWTTSVLWDLAK